MTNLGICYLRGIGTKVDTLMAKQIFERSFQNNDLEGSFYLAYLNIKEAFETQNDELNFKAFLIFQ